MTDPLWDDTARHPIRSKSAASNVSGFHPAELQPGPRPPGLPAPCLVLPLQICASIPEEVTQGEMLQAFVRLAADTEAPRAPAGKPIG